MKLPVYEISNQKGYDKLISDIRIRKFNRYS